MTTGTEEVGQRTFYFYDACTSFQEPRVAQLENVTGKRIQWTMGNSERDCFGFCILN